MEKRRRFIRGFRADLRVLEKEVGLSLSSETECCGVTPAQCHLLLEVERRGRTRLTELAPVLVLDKSTLSRTVDGLVRAGLLGRETDPENRKQQILSLTEKGKARTDFINDLCDESYARLFDLIPPEKRGMVAEAASLLAEAMRRRRTDPGALQRAQEGGACCGGTAASRRKER